ncbi:MAG: hypothetical protein U1G05_13940 [Kiritimatiellia bacterium]
MFVGIWCLVLGILSSASGWARLATRFHHPDKFDGTCHHFQSARMKGVNFNSALVIGVSPQGLYLAQMILFRLFNPPLLIPWAEIHAEPFQTFWSTGYRLTFRSFPDITLDLGRRAFDRIVAHLKSASPEGRQPLARD